MFLSAAFALAPALGLAAYADEGEPLELYPRDASDACDPAGLQIRVTIRNVTAQGIMKLELYNQDDGFFAQKRASSVYT